jgi:hypothetical protein
MRSPWVDRSNRLGISFAVIPVVFMTVIVALFVALLGAVGTEGGAEGDVIAAAATIAVTYGIAGFLIGNALGRLGAIAFVALAIGIVVFTVLTAALASGLTQPGLGSPEALRSLGAVALIFIGPAAVGGWLGWRLRNAVGWDV